MADFAYKLFKNDVIKEETEHHEDGIKMQQHQFTSLLVQNSRQIAKLQKMQCR